MAKLFISYSREDRAIVEKLAAGLAAAGHDVWWDQRIQGGAQYEKDIEAELANADAVVVAWSKAAIQSDWVKDEAAEARDKEKLIPICLDSCASPLGFRQYQTIDLGGWKGDDKTPPFKSLLAAIADRTGQPQDVPVAEPVPSSLVDRIREKPFGLAIVAATVALVTAFGLWALLKAPGEEQQKEAANTAGEAVSIAVLPFVDMSPEGNQAYFADGLSEELLNVLVRVDGLKVASRTSSFSMKDKQLNALEIADQLNVDHIVEGSVRKSANRIRITAQLIDAHTDKHLWSETYDRHLADIFRIQDEIANSVLTALSDELGITEEAPISIKPATENLDAYDMYLKARELFLARGRNNVKDSLDLYEQIVKMEPDYAEAWEGLSAVYAIASSWGITDRDYSALAVDAAKRALEIDPDLSMPYAVIGLTYRTHYPTPWEVSLSNLQTAIEKDPKNANAHLWLGMNFMGLGYHEKSMAAFDRCLEVDDAFRLCRKYKSIVHLFKGEEQAALKLAEVNAEAGYFSDFDAYLPALLARGDRLTALTLSRTLNWQEDFPHGDYVDVISSPGDVEAERFAALERWAEKRNVDLLDKTNLVLAYRAYDRMTVENFDNDYEDLWLPAFTHFRKAPEFKQLAVNLGLVDYWRADGFPEQCRALDETDFECD